MVQVELSVSLLVKIGASVSNCEPPYAIRTPDLQLTGVDDWSPE